MTTQSTAARAAALLVAGALAAAGCTTNPFTREKQVSKTATGAAIGAVAGAGIGLLIGDHGKERRRNALIGAGVGTLAGGGVGYYMDRQEAKLRQELEGTGVSVTRLDDNIVLNMPGNVTFAFDRADIQPNFYPVLTSVSKVLNEYEKTLVHVTGHTDSVGADDYNFGLSQRRADAVGSYLTAQGVLPVRVAARGFGESQPIASNETPEGRQQNRRVEITLEPFTQ
jgi:outer membrane protein OmpA-like peptidoglycan-associated protein